MNNNLPADIPSNYSAPIEYDLPSSSATALQSYQRGKIIKPINQIESAIPTIIKRNFAKVKRERTTRSILILVFMFFQYVELYIKSLTGNLVRSY
jgi:hypothetical protein